MLLKMEIIVTHTLRTILLYKCLVVFRDESASAVNLAA